ncbi:MAG TPA: hypothetical protein IGS52_17645 [Oscillatoriaceae cyanobacterium M33_DOE_052]|uniref:Uncharacterized protein n=1 Tax=Planktothricoides sp. SpSt-374 TaxID=2282167 RepID=A0A7C3ZI67_9CYAN|nr:hypothetical protein [Oscillatoriaceae cyanobacterium M33_DOE_052]
MSFVIGQKSLVIGGETGFLLKNRFLGLFSSESKLYLFFINEFSNLEEQRCVTIYLDLEEIWQQIFIPISVSNIADLRPDIVGPKVDAD